MPRNVAARHAAPPPPSAPKPATAQTLSFEVLERKYYKHALHWSSTSPALPPLLPNAWWLVNALRPQSFAHASDTPQARQAASRLWGRSGRGPMLSRQSYDETKLPP